MSKIKKCIGFLIVILIMIFIIFIVTNQSYAEIKDAFAKGFTTPGGTTIAKKSVAGIFNAMRTNPTAWVDSEAPSGDELKGWANEFGIDAMHYDDWSTDPNKSNAMIFRWGALCFGHELEDNTKVTGSKLIVYDINEHVDSSLGGEPGKDGTLAYMIYKSVTEKDRGSTDGTASRNFIRNWLIREGWTVQVADTTPLDTEEVSEEEYNALVAEAEKYKGWRLRRNLELNVRDDSEATITYKDADGDGTTDTLIGPYHIKVSNGNDSNGNNSQNSKLSKVSIKDKSNSTIETKYCSIDGTNIMELKDVEDGSHSDFYVVVKGKKITSVSKMYLAQSYNYYKARVVMAYAQDGEGGQDVAIFYAYKTEGETKLELPNPPDQSSIIIKKKDSVTGKGLKDVTFIVELKGKGFISNNGYTSNRSEAKKYTTDSNGQAIVEGLTDLGTYRIYEIENKIPGYLETSITSPVVEKEVVIEKIGESKTEEIPNQPVTDVTLVKKDKDTGKKLQNVGLVVQYQKTGEYVIDGFTGKEATFTKDITKATTYNTGNKGEATVENLSKEGKYIVYEVVNPNFGYEDVSYKNPLKVSEFTITLGENKKVEIDVQVPNKRKYVNLSGYVWLDKISTKQSERNDLYKTNKYTDRTDEYYDNKDEDLSGIKVTLKYKSTGKVALDKDGKEMTTTTSENGTYKFKNALIEKLSDYYVEFEYDGLKYQNVTKNLNENTGSKAEEGEKRQNFNNKFETVTNDKRIDGIELQYTSGDHKSTLNNSDSFSKMQANTYNAGYNIAQYYDAASGQEEIKNINLGLYEREQPDIALVKDIDNIKISINGYNHIYKYGSRYNVTSQQEYINQYYNQMYPGKDRYRKETSENGTVEYIKDENGDYVLVEDEYIYMDIFNVGVRFGSKYKDGSYTRAVYQADYNYICEEDKSKELKVYVTYKIRMKNESSNLTVKVNSVVDYFDMNYYKNEDGTYNKVKVGTQMDEKGNVGRIIDAQGNAVDEINPSVDTYNEEYAKTMIYTNAKIEAQKYFDMYVQFELNREAVSKILDNGDNLDNVAEIYSYTTYDGDKLYAGVDKDSKPGNAEPGNKDTYEDDTDSAPGLQLEVANARKIAGTVFLDNADDATPGGTGNERLGNGMYDSEETTISGVKVGLYNVGDFDDNGNIKEEATPIGEITYNESKNGGTGDDGGFTISNFIPGEYKIVYFWGDDTYTVNDYKGTIYKQTERQLSNTWYTYKPDSRFSDAMDNYKTREKIDSGENITTMDSITPIMKFGVEFEDIKNTFKPTQGIDKVEFVISNVDFGIIERPKQALDMEKRVKSIKISSDAGQTLVGGEVVEENGILKLNYEQNIVGGMAPAKGVTPENGYLKAEIDSEILYGSNLQIEYEIVIKNNSEIDYNSENYYKYGMFGKNESKEETLIKIRPTGVYDYLDSELELDEGNTDWEEITIEDYNNNYVTEPTIVEEYLYEYSSSSTDSDGVTTTVTGYESFTQQYQEAIENWSTETIRTEKIKASRAKRLEDKKILRNANLEKEIEPGEENSVTLYVAQELANKDEIELNNDAEIVKVTSNQATGRKVTPKTSVIYDRGETVTITTPTGENKNYTSIIIVALSGLIILGTGAIFIKKKVLR